MERFLSFNEHMQSIFGERVYKVSIDAGLTCPNRDGTKGVKGCIFCDRFGSSSRIGVEAGVAKSISEQTIENISTRSKQQAKPKKYIAYFQSFTNTYGSVEQLSMIYDEAIYAHKDIVGLSISTRSDCIDQKKIELINSYTDMLRYVAIEYGMQSIYDKSLLFFERKETHQDFLQAVELTQRYPKIHLCVHVILGSFVESREEIIAMAKYLGDMKINGIKIHLMTVLKDTRLNEFFNNINVDKYDKNHLASFDESISLVCDFLERVPPSMVIHKIAGYGHIDDICYPSWIKAYKDKINIAVINELTKRDSFQGKYFS
ncbi:MAG: TIGR01212 family radical SAM protein [Oligoflexia bacterium]|nr:TIGR01212 family radical SAM protein [Oligoflexia bacterium]